MDGNVNNSNSACRIIVLGVGGAGNNAINRMINDNLTNVEFYALNTDKQVLINSKVDPSHRIVLGEEIVNGLGAGGDPDIGRKAAEASKDTIRSIVKGANLVFIAAGMGGGTGTGAAPIIGNICREEGCLTVAIVTRPFSFEGKNRVSKAAQGLKNLKESVDSYIVISNDRLLMTNGSDPIQNAFGESDKVLSLSVKTVSELILVTGVINLDFADVRNILKDSGLSLIGYGESDGPNKAIEAANMAITSPLLEIDIKGAKKAICAVKCGKNISLFDAQASVSYITKSAGNCLDVKLGVSIDESLGDKIVVSVIASSFSEEFDFESDNIDEQISNQNEKIEEAKKNKIKETENKNTEISNEDDDFLPNFFKDKDL